MTNIRNDTLDMEAVKVRNENHNHNSRQKREGEGQLGNMFNIIHLKCPLLEIIIFKYESKDK